MKFVCDALNKLAFEDDSQIVSCEASKMYVANSTDVARTEVLMYQLEVPENKEVNSSSSVIVLDDE